MAFDGSGLTSIIIPNSVTNIGSDAFRNCPNLTIYVVADSIATLGTEWHGNRPVYWSTRWVTFNSSAGSGTSREIHFANNGRTELPNIHELNFTAPAGMILNGWATTPNATTPNILSYNDIIALGTNSHLTLYAIYITAPPTLNLSHLQRRVNEITNENLNYQDFTPATWSLFAEVLASANELLKSHNTGDTFDQELQDKINETYNVLGTARNNLEQRYTGGQTGTGNNGNNGSGGQRWQAILLYIGLALLIVTAMILMFWFFARRDKRTK